jgi:YD repeat-containing protein
MLSFSGDDCRGKADRYDAWGDRIATANPYVAQELAKAEDRPELKAHIWQKYAEKFTYNEAGLKTKYQDVYGHTTFYYYNQDQHLVLKIDPTGAAIQYTVNRFGKVMEEYAYYKRLPEKIVSSLQGGYITTDVEALLIKDSQDRVTTFKRDARDKVIKKIDAEGRESSFTYNAFKDRTDEYLPASTPTPLHIQHAYDTRGFEIKTVQANQGQIITVEKKYEHPRGMQTDLVDESGLYTHFVRDSLGDTKEIQQKLDDQMITIETITRDFLGRPIKKINADNQVTAIEYNQKDRDTIIRHETTNAQVISTNNIFDEPIKIVKTAMDDARILHQQSFEHAPNGEVIIEQDGVGNVKQIDLDLMGYKKAKWNANHIKTQYAYNPAYQLTEKTVDAVDDGLNLKTTYTGTGSVVFLDNIMYFMQIS